MNSSSQTSRLLPVVLTVAGSDNSAGAGIQADLKTFTALQTYGLTAITAVVAEVPGCVKAIGPVTPEIIAEQVRLSFEAFPVAAMKTGMLFSCDIIEAVCKVLEELPVIPPLVVDPVMIASSGDALLEADAVDAYKARLFPMATLVTPNLDEASALVGRKLTTLEAMREAGRELCEQYNTAFLLKGGHLEGAPVDLLMLPSSQGGEEIAFQSQRVEGVSTHGTGCTFSAAIAARLAHGDSLASAVEAGKKYIASTIEKYYEWEHRGGVTHALNHQH